jgi:hypothetical protein
MSMVVPVSFSAMGARAWKQGGSFKFAASSLIVPMDADGLAEAATNIALAFTAGEKITPVGVLGLRPGENLYVGPDGKWLGRYIPAVLRHYPFRLLRAEGEQFALGFDTASGLLAEAGEGEPFFDEHARPTGSIQQILQDLVRVHRGQELLERASALLAEHDLLEPWPLKIQDGGNDRSVTGLLRVSESRLSALDDAAFLQLRRGGALVVAYAQLLSMPNIAVLGRLAQLHAQHAAHASRREAEVSAMFEPLTESDGEIDWAALLNEDQA